MRHGWDFPIRLIAGDGTDPRGREKNALERKSFGDGPSLCQASSRAGARRRGEASANTGIRAFCAGPGGQRAYRRVKEREEQGSLVQLLEKKLFMPWCARCCAGLRGTTGPGGWGKGHTRRSTEIWHPIEQPPELMAGKEI